jgi:hypothetical protein
VVWLLLVVVAACLLWELWSAVTPTPIADDFLKLLDDSFARLAQSAHLAVGASRLGLRLYAGAASTVGVAVLLSAVIASSTPAKAPTVHIETSQRFRPIQ